MSRAITIASRKFPGQRVLLSFPDPFSHAMGLLKPLGSRGRAAAAALAQEAGELKEGPRARRVRPSPWRCAHLPAGTPPARNFPIVQPPGPEHPFPHASPDTATAIVAVDKLVAHIPAAGAPVLLHPICGTGPPSPVSRCFSKSRICAAQPTRLSMGSHVSCAAE